MIIHDKILNSWFLDLGLVWDRFCGIGSQKGWRKEIYQDKEFWNKWKQVNLRQ